MPHSKPPRERPRARPVHVLRDENGNAATCPVTPFYVVIPTVENFTDDETAAYETGEYSLRLSAHLPVHETFADYIIDRSLDAWTRSRG